MKFITEEIVELLKAQNIRVTAENKVLKKDLVRAIEIIAGRDYYWEEDKAFEAFPQGVILDGDDDWYSAKIAHPGSVAADAKIKKLGTFHSGNSGINTSGIIIDKKDLAKFKKAFQKMAKDPEAVKGGKPNYSAYEKPYDYKIEVIYADGKKEILTAKGTRYGF